MQRIRRKEMAREAAYTCYIYPRNNEIRDVKRLEEENSGKFLFCAQVMFICSEPEN